jgi:4-amino-4-deoxy-L-arabinose transferase-like glycosyltransferase
VIRTEEAGRIQFRTLGGHAFRIALLFLALYVITAGHTVTLAHDDAAEFQTVGAAGGVPHQPYPLWCILARAISLLPLGEPAWRVTLLSIFFGAAAVGLLFLLLYELTRDHIASAVASVAFGLTFSFWQNAVVAEIYSLTACLIVITLYCWMRWQRTGSWSVWICFVTSLGFLLSFHQLNMAIIPALCLLLVRQRERVKAMLSGQRLALSLLVFLAPFTLYFYTYLVDRGDLPMNWYRNFGGYLYASQGFDVERFTGFFERMRFQMFVGRLGPLFPPFEELVSRFLLWIRHVGAFEFPIVGSLVIALGFLRLWKRETHMASFWTLYAAPSLLFALIVAGGVTRHEYSIPVLVIFAVFLAAGFSCTRGALHNHDTARRIVTLIIGFLIVALPVTRLSISSPIRAIRDMRAQEQGYRADMLFWHLTASNSDGRLLAEQVSQSVPPNSLVIAPWREANVLFYQKYVKGDFEDVDLSYVMPNDTLMAQLIARTNRDQVFFTNVLPSVYGFETVESFRVEPAHTLYRIHMGTTDGE